VAPPRPSVHPYRLAPNGVPCPRCSERLAEEEYHDVVALDCSGCHGLFLDKSTIDKLGSPEGASLRLAFPNRPRRDEDRVVRYLTCPVCHSMMNRTIFARVSGVIVDVCKEHGVWFDAGEINAILAFIESGGLERARAKQKAEHDAEHARLHAEYRKVHEDMVAASPYRGGWATTSSSSRFFAASLSDLFF
jgi:Zn-finger nucleic acid-binding protein